MKNKNPENKKLFSELEEGMSELILHAEIKKFKNEYREFRKSFRKK